MALSQSSKMAAMAVIRTAIMNNHPRISKVDATSTAYWVLDRLEANGFNLEDTHAEENHAARKAKKAKMAEYQKQLEEEKGY